MPVSPSGFVRGRRAGLVALACLAGCSGEIGGTATTGAGRPPGAPAAGGASGGGPTAPSGSLAPVPISRLTNLQYNNTLADLFTPITIPAQPLPDELTIGGFLNNAHAQAPSPTLIEDLANSAHAVATLAVADLGRLLPCQTATPSDEPGCGTQFIAGFGKRAFRRPLTAGEASDLGALFSQARTGYGFATAIRVVIEAILQSPAFLYLIEQGTPLPDGRFRLQPHELASRLSYFLTNTMPDASLFAAADSGTLDDPAELDRQARRLLADPRAHAAVATFHEQWLRLDRFNGLTKNATKFPAWGAATAQALRDATARFADYAFWSGGTLSALLTDNHGFVNDALAPLYGVSAPHSTALVSVALDPAQRSGILTQPGMMAIFAHETDDSPVLRGVFVLDRVMCTPAPPPPPAINVTPPAPDPTTPMTTRQRFATTHEQGTCAGCHHLIDGIGFGFEHYDASGAWRTSDAGFPVDATGTISGTGDIDGPFDGAVELGRKLAGSKQVQACVATEWLRYALGMDSSEISDVMTAPVIQAFKDAKLSLSELLVAVIKSDAFRLRARNP